MGLGPSQLQLMLPNFPGTRTHLCEDLMPSFRSKVGRSPPPPLSDVGFKVLARFPFSLRVSKSHQLASDPLFSDSGGARDGFFFMAGCTFRFAWI